MKQLLKPTWVKVLLVIAFSIAPTSAYAQRWDGTPPKPPLYDLWVALPLDQGMATATWLYLIYPMLIAGAILSIMGVNVRAAGLQLHVLAHGVYFYLLASLLVLCLNHYKNRFTGWLWAAFLLVLVALYGRCVAIKSDAVSLQSWSGQHRQNSPGDGTFHNSRIAL